MNSLATLFPDTNNGELHDKAKELSHIHKELRVVKEDPYMKPSRKVRKLRELRENLKYCREEYENLSKDILVNFI
jgi:hypothetical protein